MFCKNCGKEIDDKAVICPHCGVAQTELTKPEVKKPVNGVGVTGFVVGLLSIWLGIYFCIASIIGVILSAVGIATAKKHSVNGLAIAGLVISIITLVIYAIIWLVVGAAVIGGTAV